MVSVPLASTTGTMVQKTPMGVKYITVLMIFRQTSLPDSITFSSGSPFSPIATRVKPVITAKVSTCSILPLAKAATGLAGIRFLTVSRMLVILLASISEVAISNRTPFPRLMALGIISPTKLASAVVNRKNIMAPPVIFPVVLALPMLVMPTTMEQNTSGKIIMFSAFM